MGRTWLPYARHGHGRPVPGAPALEVVDLRAGHPGATDLALDGVSLTVPVGARVALVGANGAGKSTLLKAVAGLLPTRGGAIRLQGMPVGACHHRVAYLAQRGEVDWAFPVSVRRLVLSGRYVHLGWLRRPGPGDRAAVAATLDRLGIADLADRQVGRLSGGQQQRVLLARALVQGAETLLLDEPLTAVDAETRASIEGVLRGLHRGGATLVVATHDRDRLATDYDAVVHLRDGRVRAATAAAAAAAVSSIAIAPVREGYAVAR